MSTPNTHIPRSDLYKVWDQHALPFFDWLNNLAELPDDRRALILDGVQGALYNSIKAAWGLGAKKEAPRLTIAFPLI